MVGVAGFEPPTPRPEQQSVHYLSLEITPEQVHAFLDLVVREQPISHRLRRFVVDRQSHHDRYVQAVNSSERVHRPKLCISVAARFATKSPVRRSSVFLMALEPSLGLIPTRTSCGTHSRSLLSVNTFATFGAVSRAASTAIIVIDAIAIISAEEPEIPAPAGAWE